MGRREARRVQDRVHLDTLVRIRRWGPPNDSRTGLPATLTDDVMVWAAVESGRSELNVRGSSSTLVFPSAIVVRHDARWASLEGIRLEINLPESPDRDDRIANVERIGRRRFLRLEVAA